MPNLRCSLRAFWLALPPFDIAGRTARFGPTAFSELDALRILSWSGLRLRAELAEFIVIRGVIYAEPALPGFRADVAVNMGPIVVRGMWYPYLTAAPPAASALADIFPEPFGAASA